MKALSDFLPRILPYAPACSDPLAEQALLDAAIEFCERSLVLRQQLDPFQTTAGIVEYDIQPYSPQLDVARVLAVTLDNLPVNPLFADDVGIPTVTSNDPRWFYTQRDEQNQLQLCLSPVPGEAQTAAVLIALRPDKSATELADMLFHTWDEVLSYGALARILRVPGQSFTDGAAATYYLQRFNAGVTKARTEGGYGHVRGATRVAPRPLFKRNLA